MKIALTLMAAFVAMVFLPVSATIINIPDDYPAIQEGIDASSDGDTVLVQPATYVENINFNGHNVVLGSLFLTTGDIGYISTTIIDGNHAGSVVSFVNGENAAASIIGFTIRNGNGQPNGGGINCSSDSSPIIFGNVIMENHSIGGGGISCSQSSAQISHNLIIQNNAFQVEGSFGNGGGIGIFYDSNPEIGANVIIGNHADNDGGGVYCDYTSDPTFIVNTIVWGNTAGDFPQIFGNPVVSYCDVEGGWEGEGNIDTDPLFRDSESGDYHLISTECGDPYNSPCIDAGDPSICDIILDCNHGLGEIRSDIGAYSGGINCNEIPTLSEWGMLIMGLMLLAIGTVAVVRRRRVFITEQ